MKIVCECLQCGTVWSDSLDSTQLDKMRHGVYENIGNDGCVACMSPVSEIDIIYKGRVWNGAKFETRGILNDLIKHIKTETKTNNIPFIKFKLIDFIVKK